MKKNLMCAGISSLTVAVILLPIVMSGCRDVATFDYSAASGMPVQFQECGSAKKTITVMPVLDQRGLIPDGKEKQAIAVPEDSNKMLIGFLPLTPFGTFRKVFPEKNDQFITLGRFHSNVAQDLSAAEQISLKSSNLFAEVLAGTSPSSAKTDYLWRSRVTSTVYKGYVLSYGVTLFAAPALWIVGAPCGYSVNELKIGFELLDRRSMQTLWQYDFNGSDYLFHWVYARVGDDTSLYAVLMKRAMNQALQNLTKTQPAIFR